MSHNCQSFSILLTDCSQLYNTLHVSVISKLKKKNGNNAPNMIKVEFANSVDLDEVDHMPSHLDLRCMPSVL